jgi:hypothetical protein
MGEEEYVSDTEAAALASSPRPGFRARLKKPDPVAVRKYAATTPFLWVWSIVLGLAALQIYFDPFGFSNLTQRYSQDLVNLTLTGPLYGDAGRDKVSVVLIEEPSLQQMSTTWPLTYGTRRRDGRHSLRRQARGGPFARGTGTRDRSLQTGRRSDLLRRFSAHRSGPCRYR